MSADDLIRDPATIRATDEPDRDDRYWAAITRDRSVGSVDAVTRLADSEQAATNNRLDQAEARVDALLTERDELRASVTEYEGSLQAAQSRLARVAELADDADNTSDFLAEGGDTHDAAMAGAVRGLTDRIRDVLGVQR